MVTCVVRVDLWERPIRRRELGGAVLLSSFHSGPFRSDNDNSTFAVPNGAESLSSAYPPLKRLVLLSVLLILILTG